MCIYLWLIWEVCIVFLIILLVVVVQSPSRVPLFVTPTDCSMQGLLSLTISRSLPEFMSIASVIPSSHLILSCPLFLLPSVFPSIKDFSVSQLFASDDQILEFQLQHQSFQSVFRIDFPQDWLIWSPCCPRDSQESSPTPQLKGINSSALSFLYSPALTSICDYWKN